MIADLFYGVVLGNEHIEKAKERLEIYMKVNRKVEILGSLLITTPDDKLLHIYLEPDFVLAVNLSCPELSELGHANVPLAGLPKKHGCVAEIDYSIEFIEEGSNDNSTC